MVSSNEIIDRIKFSISNSKKFEEIQLHEPYFKGSNAYKYLKECIDTGWVSSSGKWVTEFEGLISTFPKLLKAFLHSSTSSLNSLGSNEKKLSIAPSFLLKVKCFSIIHAPRETAATEAPIPKV